MWRIRIKATSERKKNYLQVELRCWKESEKLIFFGSRIHEKISRNKKSIKIFFCISINDDVDLNNCTVIHKEGEKFRAININYFMSIKMSSCNIFVIFYVRRDSNENDKCHEREKYLCCNLLNTPSDV